MGKLAIVTEKQSVAQDIVAVLGGFTKDGDSFENDQYIVTWAVGHIVTLPAPEEIDPKYKRWVLQDLPIIPEKFQLQPLDRMKGRLDLMAKIFRRKDVDTIVNACDAGREGELIFREIIEYTGTEKPIQRLWLQSMTAAAIREGFAHLEPGEKYEGLADAAWCRSEADWLVGMNATRAVTKRLQTRKAPQVWSAGRVQTPTLAMLVDHEDKILAFSPRPFWQIKGTFQATDHSYISLWFQPGWKGNTDTGERDDRIFDRAQAERLLEKVTGKPGVASETRKPERESAPLLFDLTSLQRDANRRFSFSARRTLQAAQRLYEAHKALTYPRTDSKHLPEDYGPHVANVLQVFSGVSPFAPFAKKLLSVGMLNRDKIFNNAKVSDHFAIIPTGEIPKNLEGDDARIFDLVMRRFLSAFYPHAVWNKVERITEVESEMFRARSRTLQEPGWREVMGSEENPEERLPPLVAGQDKADGVGVRALELSLEESVTRPPGRISEDRLLGMMERAGKELEDEELSEAMAEKGLGTPATRADTIENLISKGYVQRLREGLKPTAKGIRLIDFLHRIHSSGLTSAEMTGGWEKNLRDVEHGQMERSQFMHDIASFTREIVEKVKEFEYEELYKSEPPVGKCPRDGESPVEEFFWGYRCAGESESGKGCPKCGAESTFIIWKEISGRYIDRGTAGLLLANGKTPTLAGFSNQQGREYQGSLFLDDSLAVKLLGEESDGGGDDDEPEEVSGEVLGECPKGQDCQVLETSKRFVCHRVLEGATSKDANCCGFSMPKLVCKREISTEEAAEYLANGRTQVLEGFISKRGRPFPAILYMKDTGRHGYEFPPREGKPKAEKKTVAKKATAKKTTAKKTTAKKTAKKATAKKATAKKA